MFVLYTTSMNNQRGFSIIEVFIIIFILAVLSGVGIIAWRTLVHSPSRAATHSTSSVKKSQPNASPASFKVSTVSSLNNLQNVKGIEIKAPTDSSNVYTLLAHYTDGTVQNLATITGDLDPRTLSIDGTKVYFIINEQSNNVFELAYLDMADLTKGATEVKNFSDWYAKASQFCDATGCSAYPTMVSVQGTKIYATQFSQNTNISRLIRYDTMTGNASQLALTPTVEWTDWVADYHDNRVLYLNHDVGLLYSANMDGSDPHSVAAGKYFGSTGSFTSYIFYGEPIFGVTDPQSDSSNELPLSPYQYNPTDNSLIPASVTDPDYKLPHYFSVNQY